MGDISPVIIAVCGLSIICIGLIVVGGFLLLRFTGTNVFGPVLGALVGMGGDEDAESDYTPRRRSPADSPARRIRKSSAPDDFDAAVERYRQGGARPSSSGSLRRPSRLGGLDDKEDAPTGSLRRDRSRDRDRGEGEEFYDDDDGGFFEV